MKSRTSEVIAGVKISHSLLVLFKYVRSGCPYFLAFWSCLVHYKFLSLRQTVNWLTAYCTGYIFFLFTVALRPNTGHGLLILEVFLDHSQRRTAVGRTPLDEWSALCRDLYLTTHNTYNRHTCPRGIRTHDLSRRAAADLRLRPRGYWNRLMVLDIMARNPRKSWRNCEWDEFGTRLVSY